MMASILHDAKRWLAPFATVPLCLALVAGCPTEGGDLNTPFDLGGDSVVNVNVNADNSAEANDAAGADSGGAPSEDAEVDESGAPSALLPPASEPNEPATSGAIEFITPADGDVLSATVRNYQLGWTASGLSDPEFELALQNADGTPFRNYGRRGFAVGNGEYEAGWTPGSSGRIAPGDYLLIIRDSRSGESDSVKIHLE